MAFCSNCGKPATAAFCGNCGAQVKAPDAGAPQAVQAPPPVAYTPAMQLPPVAVKAGTSPIVWIIGIVLGLFVLGGIVVASLGLFVAHKVREASRNPAMAVTKLLAAVNPDVSVVSTDESRGLITLRDKKTGETITVNLDDVKNGKVTFQGHDGKKLTMEAHGEGDKGTFEMKSEDGSMKFGAGANAKVPSWIPSYPGSTPLGNFSAQNKDGDADSFHFTTGDAPAKVLSFYQDALKQAGFQITANFSGQASGQNGGMLTAEDSASKHNVVVTVGSSGSGATANIMFEAKP